MAMLGEQFMVGEEICGAVMSVRYQVSDVESLIHHALFVRCGWTFQFPCPVIKAFQHELDIWVLIQK